MIGVEEKSIFQVIEEMSNDDKEQILETCLSSKDYIRGSVDYLYRLQDWFDVYVCSDKFTSLSIDQKTNVVKDFRGLYEFLHSLNQDLM